MTAETIEGAGYDWGDILDEGETKSREGPLRGSRTPSGQSRRRRASKNKLDALQKQLSQQMFIAGSMVGLGLPVTGYYACQESDTFTKAIVDLASARPEWIE